MRTDEAIIAILAEIDRSNEIHGPLPPDRLHQAAIMGEGALETIQAATAYNFGPKDLQHRRNSLLDMKKEAIQTGAMALKILQTLP